MTVLARYMTLKLWRTFAAVYGMFLVFFIFIALSSDDHVGVLHYTFFDAVKIKLMQTPLLLHSFLLLMLLISVFLSVGRMSSRSEVVVMMSVGYSRTSISRCIVLSVAVIACVSSFLVDRYAVGLAHYADHKSYYLQNGHKEAMHTTTNQWLYWQGGHVHIDAMTKPSHLLGVTRISLTSHGHLRRIDYADRLDWLQGHWQAHSTCYTQWVGGLSASCRPKVSFSLPQPDCIQTMNQTFNTDRATIKEIYKQASLVSYMGQNQESMALVYEYMTRLLLPFLCVFIVYLMIPLLYTLPRLASSSLRLMCAVVTGIVYSVAVHVVGSFGGLLIRFEHYACVIPVLVTVFFVVVMRVIWYIKYN